MIDPSTSQGRISACMIVKNEEKNLPRCLASIHDWVDEIIVVDTGSTDKTVEIAKRFGAKIYHHPWEKHFSKHRNQSIDYAGGDWIFIIDADEELIHDGGKVLKQAIAVEGDFDAVAIPVENVYEGGAKAEANSIRLFRNNMGIRYKGRVHNYLVGVKNAMCVPARLFHYGYDLDRKGKKHKFQRTTELLKKEIAEDPANPRPHHFLGVSYLFENMHKKAAEEALLAVSLYEEQKAMSHNYLWSLYIASSALFNMGDFDRAERLSSKGSRIDERHLDSWYMLAVIAYERKDQKNFEKAFQRYLEIKGSYEKNPNEFAHMVHNTAGSWWRLHLLQGCLYLEQGREDLSGGEFKKSRALCPDLSQYHLKLGYYFEQKGCYQDAKEKYSKSVTLKPHDSEILWSLARISRSLGCTKDEIVWLEKLLQFVPQSIDGLLKLGSAYIREGRFDEGLEVTRRARQFDPHNQQAKLNEAISLRGLGQLQTAIQLLREIKPSKPSERLTVASNLAFAYYDTGKKESAKACFQEMAHLQPEALAPPVYLSRLYLDGDDVDACVDACGRLLSLLGGEDDIVLNRLEDLGALYLWMGKRLALDYHQQRLAAMCFETATLLGCEGAVAMAKVGVSMVKANDFNEGATFLEQAMRMAPNSAQVQSLMAEATDLLEKKRDEKTVG